MEEDEVDDAEAEAEADQGDKHVVAYWVLYIDIFFISFDGNPFDAAWAATMAALRDTKLPLARYDADREMVVCSRKELSPLTITNIPVACTAVIFTGKETDRPTDDKFWMLSDPDRLEESLCDESITIVVDCKGGDTQILSISKHGGTVLTPKLLTSKQFLSWASKRWEEVNTAITQS